MSENVSGDVTNIGGVVFTTVDSDTVKGKGHPDPDAALVRDRAVAMLPLPGTDLYVYVVEAGTNWAVGTCGWDDEVGRQGHVYSTLANAVAYAADRIRYMS